MEQGEKHVLLANPHWFLLMGLAAMLPVQLAAGQVLQIVHLVLRENT